MQNYYEVLGLTPAASDVDIKSAYRKKALSLHPDRGGTTEGFQKLQEAYDVLGDAEKRKSYDFKQRATSSKPTSHTDSEYDPYHWRDSYDYTDDTYSGSSGSGKNSKEWDELFKTVFRKHEEASRQRENKDVTIRATITMKQSFFGATLSAKFKLPNGTTKQVLVDIPAGVADQQTIVIKGAGDNSALWKPAGDLKVLVTVTGQPGVKRIGDDVYIDHRISVVTAMIGSQNYVVDTGICNPVSIVIQPGTTSSTLSSFYGKGFPNVVTGKRGSLFVVVYVDIPAVKNIDPATLAQLQEIYDKISKAP